MGINRHESPLNEVEFLQLGVELGIAYIRSPVSGEEFFSRYGEKGRSLRGEKELYVLTDAGGDVVCVSPDLEAVQDNARTNKLQIVPLH